MSPHIAFWWRRPLHALLHSDFFVWPRRSNGLVWFPVLLVNHWPFRRHSLDLCHLGQLIPFLGLASFEFDVYGQLYSASTLSRKPEIKTVKYIRIPLEYDSITKEDPYDYKC